MADVVIEDLDVEGYWADGLQVALKGGSARIERATLRRCTGGFAHRDGIQLMAGTYRFTARKVLVDCGEGTPVQGIFTDSGGVANGYIISYYNDGTDAAGAFARV